MTAEEKVRRSFPVWTVSHAGTVFVESLSGKSSRTVRTYATGLSHFLHYLEEDGLVPDALPVSVLRPNILEEFHGWLVQRHGRDRRATISTYLSGARAFVRFLDRRALLEPGTSAAQMAAHLRAVQGKAIYRTPRIDSGIALIVAQAEADALPTTSNGEDRRRRLEILRNRAILHALFATGMRRAEVAMLDRQDLDGGWSGHALISGKGERERTVFFSAEALTAVRSYLEARSDRFAPLFIRHDRGTPKSVVGSGDQLRLSTTGIWRVVDHYARIAGVNASPHDFRHAKASSLLNRGARLSEVQDILGHASPETTKRIYAHYETQHLRDVFDEFSASVDEAVSDALVRRERARPLPIAKTPPDGT